MKIVPVSIEQIREEAHALAENLLKRLDIRDASKVLGLAVSTLILNVPKHERDSYRDAFSDMIEHTKEFA